MDLQRLIIGSRTAVPVGAGPTRIGGGNACSGCGQPFDRLVFLTGLLNTYQLLQCNKTGYLALTEATPSNRRYLQMFATIIVASVAVSLLSVAFNEFSDAR
ncbi:MAG TPA: hypothetical protein VLI06_10415 [Solimonas sp.]|nr:hypothetical protein [Solimonas sp.]